MEPDQGVDAQPIIRELQLIIGEQALQFSLLRAKLKELEQQNQSLHETVKDLHQELRAPDNNRGDSNVHYLEHDRQE